VTSVLIDSFKNCGNIKDSLELFLLIEASSHALINIILARIYKKRIAINVSSAIDDWSLSMKKQSYVIMMEYARLGRIIILSQLMIGIICISLYFPIAFIRSKQQVESTYLYICDFLRIIIFPSSNELFINLLIIHKFVFIYDGY